MKFSSNQGLFLMLVALAVLTGLTVFHFTSADVLVGVLLGILYAGMHIAGLDRGVPLQQTGPLPGEQVHV